MAAMLKITLVMMIWGSIGIFVKLIDLPYMEIAFMRAFISGILLLVIRLTFIKEKVNYALKSILILMGSGAALGLNWVFLFKAYKYTSITKATVSYYMAPVFAVILAWLLLKERLSLRKMMALIISTLGVVLILSQSQDNTIVNGNLTLGISSGLLAAVFYALVILVNRAIKDVSGLDKTVIQILSATLILLPFVFMRGQLEIKDLNTGLLLVLIATVHTAIPYLVYFENLKKISVVKSGVLSYIDPFSAILYGYFVFGEPLNFFHLLGGTMVLGSVLMSFETFHVKLKKSS